MTSNRPTRQLSFEFDNEPDEVSCASEPQRGQSASADMKKTALNLDPQTLMEQIVDSRNMERAWKKVKANRGGPGPDGITLDEFFESFRSQ